VRIIPRALKAEELQKPCLVTGESARPPSSSLSSSDPLVYLKFNDKFGYLAQNLGTVGGVGSIFNSEWVDYGDPCQLPNPLPDPLPDQCSVGFFNIADFVLYPETNENGLLFDEKQSFTVELWLKMASWNSQPVIVGNKDWSNSKNPGWVIALIPPYNWRVNIADGTTAGDIPNLPGGDSNWHHIAMVVDRNSQTLSAYRDGHIVSSTGISQVGKVYDPFYQILVVGNDVTLNYNWQGSQHKGTQIDEVRVWNRALTSDEFHLHCMKQDNSTGLLMYLTFNECSGLTPHNRNGIPNPRCGSLSGALWYLRTC